MADNKFGLSDALINAVRQVAENNAPLPRDERERDLARQARSNPRSLDEELGFKPVKVTVGPYVGNERDQGGGHHVIAHGPNGEQRNVNQWPRDKTSAERDAAAVAKEHGLKPDKSKPYGHFIPEESELDDKGLKKIVGKEEYQLSEESEHPAVVAFASKAHEEWRKGFDPEGSGKERVKKNSDGTEGNINVPFNKLHPDWQKENLAAGRAALEAVKRHGSDTEAASEHIHNEWMKRNPKADYNAAQHVPYKDLPEDEKEKDRVHVRTMRNLLTKKEQIEVGNTSDVYFYEKMQEAAKAAKAAKYDPTKETEPHVIKKHPEGGYVVVKVSPNNPHEHIKGARITSGQESIRNYTLDGRAYTETTNEETELGEGLSRAQIRADLAYDQQLRKTPPTPEQRARAAARRKAMRGTKAAPNPPKPKKPQAYVHPEGEPEAREKEKPKDNPNENIINQLNKEALEGKHRITFRNGKTHLLPTSIVNKARTLHGNMHPSKKGDFQERLAASLESFQDALKNPDNAPPKPKGREARLAPKPLDKNFMDDLARVSRGGPARER